MTVLENGELIGRDPVNIVVRRVIGRQSPLAVGRACHEWGRAPMWVHKSHQQITRERGRQWLSFRGPILWFVTMFVGGIMLAAQGPRRAVSHWPSTWSEVILCAISFAALGAIVNYALQVVLKTRLYPFGVRVDVVICDTCHRVKRRDRDGRCECGGKFDDFENWTWVDGGEK